MKCKSNAVAVRNNEMKQTYSGNKLKYDEKTTLENNFQANKRFALKLCFTALRKHYVNYGPI